MTKRSETDARWQVEDQQWQEAFDRKANEAMEQMDKVRARCDGIIKQIKAARLATGEVTQAELDECDRLLEEERDLVRLMQYELLSIAMGRRWSSRQVKEWHDRAIELGANHPPITARLVDDLLHERVVPNAPLRERHAELRAAHIAVNRKAAAVIGCNASDVSKVLGARAQSNRKGYKPSLSVFIDYDKAEKLAKVMGMTPRQAGI